MTARDPSEMGFLDHLEELRKTLFWVMGIVMVATIVAWFFSDTIVDLLLRPAREAGQETLYFHAPMEAFLLKMKASLVVGFMVGFPLILHRVYMFVLPGLLPREKRVVTPLLVSATLLFYVGVLFCYIILLPMVVRFALGFSTEHMQPWLTVGSYFGMVARLCLAFGLLFELPMVVFALSWARVVHPRTLLRGWRWALVAILVASAILTPPDVISQVMLAGPVMVLYLGSVLISMVVRRREDDARDDDGDDGDDGPDDGPGDGPGGGPGGGPGDFPGPAGPGSGRGEVSGSPGEPAEFDAGTDGPGTTEAGTAPELTGEAPQRTAPELRAAPGTRSRESRGIHDDAQSADSGTYPDESD